MVEPSEKRDGPWHESVAAVLIVLVIGAIVTSPCWGFALMLAVTR